MTKLTSALMGMALLLTLSVTAFAQDCPKSGTGDCTKGSSCPMKKNAQRK